MNGKKLHHLEIDPGFQVLIRPLSRDERLQLEENLLRDGCLDPIIVWNEIILDGHNRYDICTRHEIPFQIVRMDFSSREEATAWICANQLGRRNISEETRKYLIGRQYEAEKTSHTTKNPGGKNQYSGVVSAGEIQMEREPPALSKSNRFRHITAQRIADENHVSWATVGKYASYSKALEIIRSKAPEIPPLILSGKYRIAHESVILLSKMGATEIRNAFREVLNGNKQAISFPNLQHRGELRSTNARKDHTPIKTVKDMPEYDPDSELTSLSLTIPSWSETILKTVDNAAFATASKEAKEKLTNMLALLIESADNLRCILSNENNRPT